MDRTYRAAADRASSSSHSLTDQLCGTKCSPPVLQDPGRGAPPHPAQCHAVPTMLLCRGSSWLSTSCFFRTVWACSLHSCRALLSLEKTHPCSNGTSCRQLRHRSRGLLSFLAAFKQPSLPVCLSPRWARRALCVPSAGTPPRWGRAMNVRSLPRPSGVCVCCQGDRHLVRLQGVSQPWLPEPREEAPQERPCDLPALPMKARRIVPRK